MDLDQFKREWAAASLGEAAKVLDHCQGQETLLVMHQLLAIQCDLLEDIRSELKAIREATETEAVEDAEPDPFQTLNGP